MTAHRPAQIARLSATVAAGAASLCLTVAAGAYIVNNMPQLVPPHDNPTPADIADPGDHHRADDSVRAVADDVVELAWTTERFVPEAGRAPAVKHQTATAATPQSNQALDGRALEGRLRIGTTYVGAQAATPRTDIVSFTVDTNALNKAGKYLGITTEPVGVTSLHTEVDTRNGAVEFVLSDPALGRHTVRIEAPGDQPGSETVEEPTTVGV
ncbi:hypothetical protein AB0I35_01410 [Nocardia sp. NPDC050378]|uniref:hypothetical protein n=1 Tax=Nocardia sp. NPDC050378 TaxID=3155400 RepID=UPI0033F3CE34